MTLEKRNEISNFIGWREINNTDARNWCSSAGITRGNSRIRRKQSRNVTLNLIEEYVRSVHFCILYYGKYFLLFIYKLPIDMKAD